MEEELCGCEKSLKDENDSSVILIVLHSQQSKPLIRYILNNNLQML